MGGGGICHWDGKFLRKFYLVYAVRLTGISEKASRKSAGGERRLNLSWSHHVFLCKIRNELAAISKEKIQDKLREIKS